MRALLPLLLRAGATALLLLGAATAVFFLIHLIPGDPAAAMLGEGAAPSDVEALRHDLGLDRPIPSQYAAWMRGLLRGDLGTSILTRKPVAAILFVVLSTNLLGDALVERLAARRAAR